MAKALGTVLRAVSVIWIAYSLIGFIDSGRPGAGYAFLRALGGLMFGIAAFWFGTWLKNRGPGPSLGQRISRAKSAWWSADFGFRLAAFSGVVLGAYLWFSSDERTIWLAVGPPVGLVVVYLAYKRLVVGASHGAAVDGAPANDGGSAASPGNEPQADPPDRGLSVATPSENSSDRARAMEELIKRMQK